MADKDICFFLIPAAPLYSALSALIEKLAAEEGAVPFMPHVTLYVGAASETEVADIAARIVAQFSSVELAFEKIDYTPQFYKTLFLQFGESTEARAISDVIRASCRQASNYRLNPHLSLLYKTMPREAQARRAQALAVPAGPYRFDGFRVVETPKAESNEAVRGWRTAFDGRLRN